MTSVHFPSGFARLLGGRDVPKDLFDKGQAILAERNEDRSQRRSNPTEYLLSGRIRCGRCGQAYIGTASHGRSQRYTYYTCFTRMRYGTKQCDNDRLPAEQLEQDRYFRAFETGTMPEDTCAPRIASLNEQAKTLERHASELTANQDDEEQPECASAEDIDQLRSALRAALKDSTPTRTKTVLHTMIDEIRIDARDHIEPTFRVPAVRVDYGYMDAGGRRLNRRERVEALRRALVDSR